MSWNAEPIHSGPLSNQSVLFSVISSCYEWLMCWLLNTISKTMTEMSDQGVHRFAARNNVQAYKARDLSRAYAEYYALQSFQ